MLRRLAASPHRPALVVTPPDSRRGRGRKLAPPPAAEAARELGLELHQTAERERAGVASPRSRAAAPGGGRRLRLRPADREPLLERARDAERAPVADPALARRGADRAGDDGRRRARPGTTIMRVSRGLDSGPVALQEPLPIEPRRVLRQLSARLAEQGGELLVRALDLPSGRRAGVHRAGRGRGHLRREDRAGGAPPRSRPRRGRAGAGRCAPSTRTSAPTSSSRTASGWGSARARAVERRPGARGDRAARTGLLVLGTATEGLALEEVQPPGKRPMAAAEFLRGHPGAPSRALRAGRGRYSRHMAERTDGGLGGPPRQTRPPRARCSAPTARAAASPGCAPRSSRAASSASTA